MSLESNTERQVRGVREKARAHEDNGHRGRALGPDHRPRDPRLPRDERDILWGTDYIANELQYGEGPAILDEVLSDKAFDEVVDWIRQTGERAAKTARHAWLWDLHYGGYSDGE